MKKIIFILLGGVMALLFAACEKENPGYLFTSEASYPIDSLVVQTPARQQAVIDEMNNTIANYENSEAGKVLGDQKKALQKTADEQKAIYDDLRDERDDLMDASDDAYDAGDYDESDRLYDLAIAKDEEVKAARKEYYATLDLIDEIDEQIEAAIGNIETEVVQLQRRLVNGVAYSSSVIDQLQGTAPLIYSIANIEAKGQGNVEKFTPYLSVIGGGRFIVEWDENIPVGRYVISLYVENEGWKNLLPAIFTIIVE